MVVWEEAQIPLNCPNFQIAPLNPIVFLPNGYKLFGRRIMIMEKIAKVARELQADCYVIGGFCKR